MPLIDLGGLVFKVATKLASMDGISPLGIETPSLDIYLKYNRMAIAALQIVTDEDWLRFQAPGETLTLAGF